MHRQRSGGNDVYSGGVLLEAHLPSGCNRARRRLPGLVLNPTFCRTVRRYEPKLAPGAVALPMAGLLWRIKNPIAVPAA